VTDALVDERRSRWPGLMRPTTARAYLDGLYSRDAFEAEVAPFLEARTVHGRLAYTKKSLDDWIDRHEPAGELLSKAALLRQLEDDDDDQDTRRQELRQ